MLHLDGVYGVPRALSARGHLPFATVWPTTASCPCGFWHVSQPEFHSEASTCYAIPGL